MKTIWELRENENVCAVDIDDVIADSTPFWIKFVNDQLGTDYKLLNDMKGQLPYNLYRKLKMKYRTCGVKADIPVIKGAADFLCTLRLAGYKTVLLTARPFEVHKNLFRLTVDWLRFNNMSYDGIIWGENKDFKVVCEIPHLKFLVEDHASYANSVARLGYRVYLLSNKYNRNRKLHDNVVRVRKFSEILEHEGMRCKKI